MNGQNEKKVMLLLQYFEENTMHKYLDTFSRNNDIEEICLMLCKYARCHGKSS